MWESIKELIKDPFASVAVASIFGNVTATIVVFFNNPKRKNETDKQHIDNMERLNGISSRLNDLTETLTELSNREDIIELNVKRTELQMSIDNDYGKQVVSKVFDEYEKLGGNSYMHARYEDYMDDSDTGGKKNEKE